MAAAVSAPRAGSDAVDYGGSGRSLLEEADGLEAGGGEGGVSAAETGAGYQGERGGGGVYITRPVRKPRSSDPVRRRFLSGADSQSGTG